MSNQRTPNLSGRLMAIAAKIQKGDRVCDIGSDHGLLPIYLLDRAITDSILITDINPEPLERARKNLAKAGWPEASPKVSFRLSDGLKSVEEGEADTLIIAGMGGELIAEILSRDPAKADTFSRFILQPRTKTTALRHMLYEQNMKIEDEDLALENGRICEIIAATPAVIAGLTRNPSADKTPTNDIEKRQFAILRTKNHPLLRDFINSKAEREQHIIESLANSAAPDAKELIKQHETKLEEYKKEVII
jgi:tRNA (adenine22-N1)-methyltransferase